jgi:hypothetical protein
VYMAMNIACSNSMNLPLPKTPPTACINPLPPIIFCRTIFVNESLSNICYRKGSFCL